MASELLSSRAGRLLRAALIVNGRPVELHAEIADGRPRPGDIFQARVTAVAPGLQAAFVALGDERDALLHVDDFELTREGRPGRQGCSVPEAARIEMRCRPGDELIVQVVRAPTETKGARVSGRIALSGHLLVFLPDASRQAVSRRLTEAAERERLGALLADLTAQGEGWLARTAAASADGPALQAEADRLRQRWQACLRDASRWAGPRCLLAEDDLLVRLVRDFAGESLERVLVDHEEDHVRTGAFMARLNPSWGGRVTHQAGRVAAFDLYGLERAFDEALEERVELRSGGHLFIEPTEALISVDVNSGSAARHGDPAAAAHAVNLEAVGEIARQLRLRQLGGIVVIDFIDMATTAQRQHVLAALRTALAADPARTHILGMSEIGLVELTRQRHGRGLSEVLTGRCAPCSGRGKSRRPSVAAAAAWLELRRRGVAPHGMHWVVSAAEEVVAELRVTAAGVEPPPRFQVDASIPEGEYDLRAADLWPSGA